VARTASTAPTTRAGEHAPRAGLLEVRRIRQGAHVRSGGLDVTQASFNGRAYSGACQPHQAPHHALAFRLPFHACLPPALESPTSWLAVVALLFAQLALATTSGPSAQERMTRAWLQACRATATILRCRRSVTSNATDASTVVRNGQAAAPSLPTVGRCSSFPRARPRAALARAFRRAARGPCHRPNPVFLQTLRLRGLTSPSTTAVVRLRRSPATRPRPNEIHVPPHCIRDRAGRHSCPGGSGFAVGSLHKGEFRVRVSQLDPRRLAARVVRRTGGDPRRRPSASWLRAHPEPRAESMRREAEAAGQRVGSAGALLDPSFVSS
jgi:hypothetical protein